jgi:hypothetical protein
MTNDANKLIPLGAVVDLRLGYPFRGAIKDAPNGPVAVVTIKGLDPDHGIDWSVFPRTTLTGRKQPDWLRAGDVLFAARGGRNFATCLSEVPVQAVCAPQFYLLRVKRNVRPNYLAWYINQAPAQKYFTQSAEGTLVQSIRRSVLEALPVPVPSLERQDLIARLYEAVRREKQLTEQLLHNREQQLRLVARELIE